MTMTTVRDEPAGIQAVALANLRASNLNPRKRFDDAALDELADSIHAEGLLQNLVVRPHPGDPGLFEIAAGERRLRAMLRLAEQGRWPRDRLVPVVVRDLTDLQLLQLATTENLSRADMTPMEEARAFARMLELGSDVETIALETGMSIRTVRTRLTLAERLAPKAIELLDAGRLTLGQAQALTAANADAQERILVQSYAFDYEDPEESFPLSPESIKRSIRHRAVPVYRAKFPLSQYEGTFTEPSIFDPDAEATFDDVDQFHRLQRAWADKLVTGYKEAWGWVEEVSYYYSFEYETPAKTERLGPKDLGVVIEYQSDGTLKVHEGLKRRSRSATGGTAAAEKDPMALTGRHLEEIRRQRTRAVQRAVLAADPHVAVALALTALTNAYTWHDILPLRADPTQDAAPEAQSAAEQLGSTIHPDLARGVGSPRYASATTAALLKDLLEIAHSENAGRLLTAFRDLIAQHVVTEYGGIADSGRLLLTTLDARLPTWRDLGADWLQLYPKARLEQLYADATGLEAGNLTRKAMIAGILDHPLGDWLDHVPDDLLLPEASQAPGGPGEEPGTGSDDEPDEDDDGSDYGDDEDALEELQAEHEAEE